MVHLKDRNRQVPGGGNFYDAATGYMAPRYASFWTIVDGCIAARLGNPSKTRQANLSTDRESVANEVDLQWAMYCHQRKYVDFYEGQPEGVQGRPFQPPVASRLPGPVRPGAGQKLQNVAAGSEILVDWLASGAEAVPAQLATERASVCLACPLNEKISSWTDIFTVFASNAIRGALKLRGDWHLSTPHDAGLHVCAACNCPIKLKVHLSIDRITAKMSKESFNALDASCWIRKEAA